MDVRYLFAVIGLLLAVWLVSSKIRSISRIRVARKSREKLRNRAADRTLVGRLFGGSRAAGKRKAPVSETNVEADVIVEAAVIPIDRDLIELKTLRSSLHEKDQTILQLQQVLEELTSTTATRESVNFLQKQLIASRAKVLQQEGELKQLRVELGKRRLPSVPTPAVQSKGEPELQPLSSQSTQTNEAMKAKLADQLTNAEAEAEGTQQNALELRRLRSELESVREDRSSARTHIEELQIRIAEQQKALEDVGQRATSAVSGDIKPLYATLDDKDDLKLIKGIGPVLERRLNELGVTTFRQLAGFTAHDIDRVSTAIAAFPGRIEREDWVGKARDLVARKTHSA